MSFATIACCRCKVTFGLDQTTYAALKQSGQTFWCPWGHQQHFAPGKSEAEKLREELEAERRRRQSAEQNVQFYADEATAEKRRAAAWKGQTTRLRNRAKAGVCPCCNRTFKQLAAHMASQHPDFTADAGDPAIRTGDPA